MPELQKLFFICALHCLVVSGLDSQDAKSETDETEVLLAAVWMSQDSCGIVLHGESSQSRTAVFSTSNLISLEKDDIIVVSKEQKEWFRRRVGVNFDFRVEFPNPSFKASKVALSIFSSDMDFLASSGDIDMAPLKLAAKNTTENGSELTIGATVVTTAMPFSSAPHSPFAQRDISSSSFFSFESRIRKPGVAKPENHHASLFAGEVALILVDPWDSHWCLTTTQRAAALSPRINKVTRAARELGIQVIWSPTEVADAHAGEPERERSISELHRRNDRDFDAKLQHHHHEFGFNSTFENPKCFSDISGCACGPYAQQCMVHLGIRRINPELEIDKSRDLTVGNVKELQTALFRRGITHLIYGGFHTNECVLNKQTGMRAMNTLGYATLLARDITDSACFRSRADADLDVNLDDVIVNLELAGVHTLSMQTALEQAGLWDSSIVDYVQIAPWGTPERPYVSEHELMVALSLPPHLRDNTKPMLITYTTDGSLPTPTSTEYLAHGFPAGIRVKQSVNITVAAFDSFTLVRKTLYSNSIIHCLRQPGAPDIRITELVPLRVTVFRSSSYSATRKLVGGVDDVPMGFKTDSAYSSWKVVSRRNFLDGAVSVHAPSQIMFELKPDLKEFVGQCFVDEGMLDHDYGFMTALIPSVICKIFIDGTLRESSAVQKVYTEAHRFRVPIPPGSKVISLVVTDAGDGNRLDTAVWQDCGFVK